MKMLNEVIDSLTACTYTGNVDCEHCVYWDASQDMDGKNCDDYAIPEMQKDALHYLRMFRDAKYALEAEKERYAEAVRTFEQAENRYKALEMGYIRATADIVDNPALSWEELKQMEGKPVWYEHEFWKGWIILGKVEQGVNCEMIPDREERWYIVKDGSAKAYRKERE